MSNQSNTLLAVLAGFAGGFVAGLLFAPQSGSSTRKRIGDSMQASTKWAERRFHEIEKHIEALEERLVATGSEFSEKLSSTTKKAVDNLVPSIPDDAESWDLEGSELKQDLRRIPGK